MNGTQGNQQVAVSAAPVSIQLGSRHLWGFTYATLDTAEIGSRNGTEIAGAIGYSLLRDLSLTVNCKTGLVKLGGPGE